MGGHKSISSSSYPVPEPKLPDYIATGNPNPDCRGNYYLAGQHNGRDYYKRGDSLYFIWYDSIMMWYVISSLLGIPGAGLWISLIDEISTDYAPQGAATGFVTVTAGV